MTSEERKSAAELLRVANEGAAMHEHERAFIRDVNRRMKPWKLSSKQREFLRSLARRYTPRTVF